MERLNELKVSLTPNSKIFKEFPFNMHYEILKYLSCKDLLRIKLINLAGFQLTSNHNLRKRIGNYFPPIHPTYFYKILFLDTQFLHRIPKIKYLFGITGLNMEINLEGMEIGDAFLGEFINILPHFPELESLNFGIYIFIYLAYNSLYNDGISQLAENLEYLPNLKKLDLSNILI